MDWQFLVFVIVGNLSCIYLGRRVERRIWSRRIRACKSTPADEQVPNEAPKTADFALVDGLPATITNPTELDVVWRLARLIDCDSNDMPRMPAMMLGRTVVDLVKNRNDEMALFLAGSLYSMAKEFPQNHG